MAESEALASMNYLNFVQNSLPYRRQVKFESQANANYVGSVVRGSLFTC